ncbi:MAG TPA: hypothetical protein VKR59_09860 [Terriglobales bacterium]|nr:hypothetical protein [Terriglobales bacterium]
MDPVWHAVQPNDVGRDEFMTLCRPLDVEPYVTINGGFGDAWSAAPKLEFRGRSQGQAVTFVPLSSIVHERYSVYNEIS